MNEDQIIKQLKNFGDIEPKNKSYENNLRKRLINQRKIQTSENNTNQNTDTESSSNGKNFMFGLSILFGGFVVVIMLLGAVVLFSSPVINQDAELQNIADEDQETDPNEINLNVNGDLITAQDILLEGYWLKIRLPADWSMQNSNYNLDELEDVVFINGDKSITVTADNINSINNQAEVYSDQEILTFENKNVYSLNDEDVASYPQANYEYNYYVTLENSEHNILFSTDNMQDIDLLKAIMDDIRYIDPYENWNERSLKFDDTSLELKLSEDWVILEEQNYSLSKNNSKYKVIIKQVEDFSENAREVSIYGKDILFDENTSSYFLKDDFDRFYKINLEIEESGEFKETIIEEIDDEETRKEIKLLISSIYFSYPDYNEFELYIDELSIFLPERFDRVKDTEYELSISEFSDKFETGAGEEITFYYFGQTDLEQDMSLVDLFGEEDHESVEFGQYKIYIVFSSEVSEHLRNKIINDISQ